MPIKNFDILGNVRLAAVLGLLAVVFSGCSKDRQVLFDLPIELRFEIPAGLNPLDRHFLTIPNVPTNLENFKEQFGVAGMDIKIIPGNAVLSAATGNETFGFLQEIQVAIYQNNDPDQDQEVFLTDNVPFNAGRNVVILPFDNDVSNLFQEDRVDFVISWRLRSTTPAFIESVINLSFSAEE
ncbi:MAG: hypothetical protein KTR24_02295 [Saprospiraceae bacterium]|nr:hypothetical protein [Saprospiraceae bacterium]